VTLVLYFSVSVVPGGVFFFFYEYFWFRMNVISFYNTCESIISKI